VEWEPIETADRLQALLAAHRDAEVVALDTEFMRRDSFFPQVALVQLCFGERAFLVDPLAVGDPAPLARLLGDPAVVKVFHSPGEDLEVFRHWLGVMPEPLFDTQRAAALLDLGFGLGYRALVEMLCGVDLPKGETRSDWLQRPLTPAQCEYAAQDVAWLLPLWRELRARCGEQGKLDWVMADGRDAVRAMSDDAVDYYPRIKNAWKLDRRQLGILRAVCRWREEVARRRDRPRGWIIDDQACLALARFDPATTEELKGQVPLPPAALRRHGDELLALLARQRGMAEGDLPPRLPGPLGARERGLLKTLRERGRALATRLQAAPEVLLPARDYELLLREAGGESIEPPAHWRGWRGEAVIEPLRSALAECLA